MATDRVLRLALLAPVWIAVGAVAADSCATPAMSPGRATAGLPDVVREARADAARLTGLRADEFEVVSAEPVTWRDGSLGCPQPGHMYTMALVPGFRVLLRAQGRQFDYHAGARGGVSLCPPGRAVEPLPDDRR